MRCEVRLCNAQDQLLLLSEMCSVPDVSVSGYRARKRGGTPDRKRLTEGQMLALTCSIHKKFKGAYGAPRVVKELRRRRFSASKKSELSD